MTKMQCSNCRGNINHKSMRCEYCGTQYKLDECENVIKVETFSNPIKIYGSEINIPYEYAKQDPNGMSKYAINQLSRNLADAIAENMEINLEYDPIHMQQHITARVRIVKPKHIF